MTSKAIYQAHGWTATTEIGGYYKIIDLEINLSSNKFNTAYFQCDKYLSPSTMVVIKWMETIEVFRGNVITCRKLDTGPLQASKYDIECEEVAAALQYKYVMSNNNRSVWIKNYDAEADQKTVSDYIEILLPEGGYKDISEAVFKSATLVPSTGERLPDMGFSNITVASAVDRVLIDTMGYGVWYEYSPDWGLVTLRYGYYNSNKGTNWNPPVDSRIAQRGKYYGVDGIVVYGDTRKIIGTAGNIQGNIICFRYSGCNSKSEAMSVADQLFKIRQNINTRYEIDFEVDRVSLAFREGDMIDISDPRINMVSPESTDPNIPNGFMIQDIKITLSTLTIGLSAGLMNIYDKLKSRLSIIDGDQIASELQEIEFDWALVAGGSGSLGSWIDVPFFMNGSTFLGDFKLTSEFAEYGMTNYGVPVEGNNAQLTQFATWHISEGMYMSGPGSVSHEAEYADLPKIIKWGELDISYVFGASSELGGRVSFDIEWGNGVIIGDASDVTVMNQLSTITHKWYIQENWNWGPTATLKWTITNAGTVAIDLEDILVKATVFYYVSAGSSTTGGTAELPESVQIKLVLYDKEDFFPPVTLGPYVMIDSPNVGATSNQIAEDIEELSQTYVGFEVAGASHTLQVAATADVSVLFRGEYLAFDDDTTIIK